MVSLISPEPLAAGGVAPPAPTAVQVMVVPVGAVSVRTTLVASSGPLLVAIIV